MRVSLKRIKFGTVEKTFAVIVHTILHHFEHRIRWSVDHVACVCKLPEIFVDFRPDLLQVGEYYGNVIVLRFRRFGGFSALACWGSGRFSAFAWSWPSGFSAFARWGFPTFLLAFSFPLTLAFTFTLTLCV
jgi:hypothetical protein